MPIGTTAEPDEAALGHLLRQLWAVCAHGSPRSVSVPSRIGGDLWSGSHHGSPGTKLGLATA